MLGQLTLHDISRGGRVLLAREGSRTAILGLPPGAPKERDLSALDYSIAMDVSSDGRSLLIAEEGEGAGPNYSVYLRRTDTETPAVLLGEGLALALSPDGKRVLAVVPSQPKQLTLLPTGAGELKRLPESGLEYQPSGTFLPDGKRFVCVAVEPGHAVRVYVQDLDGGKPRAITPEGVSIPFGVHPVSPDGRLVAAIGADRTARLYPVEGGEPRAIPGLEAGEMPIRFSADSRSLYVYRRGQLPARVFRLDLSTGRRELWKEIGPSDPAGVFSITRVLLTPDGLSYAYNAPRLLSELYVAEGLK